MRPCSQNGRLPVGRRKLVQETFLCVLVDSTCVPIFVRLRQSGRSGVKFKPLPLPFGHARFRKRQIQKFFTEPDTFADFHEFSSSLRPPKMRLFRAKKKEERIICKDTIGPSARSARALIKTASSDDGPSHSSVVRVRNRRSTNGFTWPDVRVKFRGVCALRSKRPTSCRTREVRPRDFFVRLGGLYVRTEFRLRTPKWAKGAKILSPAHFCLAMPTSENQIRFAVSPCRTCV